jgi:glycosyl transferase, family 25
MTVPIPVYVINLPESTGRRASIERQAKSLAFAPHFVEAVDGRAGRHPLFKRVNEEKRLRLKGRPFKPGELGVWASHYKLWEQCVCENQVMVVLEDDAQLKPNFPEFLKKAAIIAEQFPYLRLYESDFASKKLATIEGFHVHRYWRSPLRATGYLLAPEAAKAFISQADEWVLPVDDYMDLPWLHGVDCLGLKPGCMLEHTEFESTIQTRAPKERLGLIHKMRREAFRHYLRFKYCMDFARRAFN